MAFVTNPLVSVVIIEYNSLEDIGSCISSIKKRLSNTCHEIIITSNSCYDTNKQCSAIKRYPDAIWCFNEKNGGFAYAMNRGLAMAKGRYLCIINPDVIVLDGFNNMIAFMEMHNEVGAIGPQMIDENGNIQDSCRKYLSLLRYIIRQIRRNMKDIPVLDKNIDHSLTQTVDWLSGAFIMVQKKAYLDTQGLDDKYFMYAEDLDWCSRIRQSGYEIVYFPEMRILFSGTRNARKFNKYAWIFIKSHLRFWIKFGFFSGYPERKVIIYGTKANGILKVNNK